MSAMKLEAAGKIIKMSRKITFGGNLVADVFLRGPIDSSTGLLVNLIDIDRVVKNAIAKIDAKKESQVIAKELFQEIQTQLPQAFPEIKIQIDKLRLQVAEDLILECGV